MDLKVGQYIGREGNLTLTGNTIVLMTLSMSKCVKVTVTGV